MDDAPNTKKSLGQHWLTDAASLQAMCDAADVQSDDIVLEIGPGPGALTNLLVDRADHVIAVEVDEHLAADLPRRVPAKNLSIVQQDILRFDFSTLPAGYKVVANIPYYLTSNLIRILSETSNPPQLVALLVQKEVAERVAAQPGDMSLLSVTAQFYWDVSLRRVVPAKLFTPPPKVDSQILTMSRPSTPRFTAVDTAKFFRLAKAGFSQRRKTLLNSLSAGLHLSREEAAQVLADAGITATDRAQALSLGKWYDLYLALQHAEKF